MEPSKKIGNAIIFRFGKDDNSAVSSGCLWITLSEQVEYRILYLQIVAHKGGDECRYFEGI